MNITCYAYLILLDLIMSYKAFIMQSSPASCHFLPLMSKIFSTTPCTQTPSIYAPSLVKKTQFHTHTKLMVKLWFCIF
jgi:putative component of membrane protein insertase Oxa1/YidC/SpoIIIJ protein YidD